MELQAIYIAEKKKVFTNLAVVFKTVRPIPGVRANKEFHEQCVKLFLMDIYLGDKEIYFQLCHRIRKVSNPTRLGTNITLFSCV